MQRRTVITAVALIGIGVVMGVALMTSLSNNAIESLFAAGADIGAKNAPIAMSESVRQMNDAFVNVSDAVAKTVVNISVKTEPKRSERQSDPFFRFFGPDGQDRPEAEGTGSGVFITADGYIVTNNHVVEEAKEGGITVQTLDGHEYKAKLVGRDPLTDVAVIKVEGGPFPAAHFGDRKDIKIGQWVVAVGSPLGLKSTITAGIISATGRGIGIIGTDDNTGERNRYAIESFLQTDAAINPGNSGGGLFNLSGSLVGINTAIASRFGVNAGYGFAIPIDMVKSVALDLMDDGKIHRGYIGVEISSVDESAAKAAGLNKVTGVMVNRVVKDGAARAAGVEVGDIILEVDGRPVRSSNELQNEIVLRRAGDRVALKLWRDGKEITKNVTLKSLDGDDDIAEGRAGGTLDVSSDGEKVRFKGLGFTAGPLTEKARRDLETDEGVLVTDVDQRGALARRGMRS
jgi:serine protease Do